ncbi:MAG TPA: hypothetical protein VJ804_00945 [Acidimicrobiales bacterium]|nr:hypothetical protein [Acidimicrobiales bacterium]
MPTPVRLRVAAGLVAVETVVEAGIIAGREELTPGLRVMIILFLSTKWIFAARVLKLRAGPALGLFLLEGTTLLFLLGARDTNGAVRIALAVAALSAIVLLAGSLHAFPPVPLPAPESRHGRPRRP